MRRLFAIGVIGAGLLSGCGGGSQSPLPAAYSEMSSATSSAVSFPEVFSGKSDFTLYDALSPNGLEPDADPLTLGPDGNFWYMGGSLDAIVRTVPGGASTQLSIPAMPMEQAFAESVTTGSDGNIWYGAGNGNGTCLIGSLTPSGTFGPQYTIFDPGCAANVGPQLAGTGVWFAAGNDEVQSYVGYLTPSGSIKQFSIPSTYCGQCQLISINHGPDGNLWFNVASQSEYVGQITPSGTMTFFSTAPLSSIKNIIAGPDGDLWFNAKNESGSDVVAKMSRAGHIIRTYVMKYPIFHLTVGADHNVWATNGGGGLTRITPSGIISNFLFPSSDNGDVPHGIAVGTDSHIWFSLAPGGVGTKFLGTFSIPITALDQ